MDIDNSKTFMGYYDLSADTILWYANDAGNDGNPATGDNPFENINCAGMVWAGASQNSKSFTLVKEEDCPFTIPTGYNFLSTTNIAENVTLPTSTIDDHFRTILYTGNGSTQTITTTIRPDFIWTKNRTSSGPAIVDAVRGATKSVQTNSQGAEFTSSNSITSLGSSGYDLGSDGDHGSFNDNGDAHVAWVAQLGGVPSATNSAGAGATPTAGSVKIDNSNYGSALAGTIPVTKLSASTELGMSCISYTGNGSAGATFFHGLGVIPEFFIVKRLDTSGTDWIVYHSALGATKNLVLNNTGIGSTSATRWNNTEPTSTLISLGTTTAVNGSGSTYICYAFAPSAFCMVTSWLGNNNCERYFRAYAVHFVRWHLADGTSMGFDKTKLFVGSKLVYV